MLLISNTLKYFILVSDNFILVIILKFQFGELILKNQNLGLGKTLCHQDG